MLMHRDRRATTAWPPLRLAAARSPGEGHRLRRGACAGDQPALGSPQSATLWGDPCAPLLAGALFRAILAIAGYEYRP
jgi:hypothetical protein